MPLSFKTALSVWVQPGDNQATGYNLKFGSEKIERETAARVEWISKSRVPTNQRHVPAGSMSSRVLENLSIVSHFGNNALLEKETPENF
jgi:hypothetical protein